MARKNRTPEEIERRAKIRELLQVSNVNSMADIQNLFKETIAEFMENSLDAELDDELGYSKYDYRSKDTDNSRNGHSGKTLRTSFGEVDISVPRDRKGEFEPQVLKKNQTSISQDIEEKILSMYAKGMTTGDIEAHIRDIYGVEVSDTTVSRITDKILPIAKEWQQRPLQAVYAVVFLDAIHYHVRSEGQIVKKAVYIAIGIDLDGKKDVLGMWVGENESAKFWATVLNGLKNRGVEDIFIACTDNLTGFSAAIEAVFPKTEIQNCIVHQLRNSSKYVSYKDLKALMADLKAVYAAVDEPSALTALDTFSERWDQKYPKISQSWRENWANLSTYFKYPQEVRRLIYTTNTIEGFNRQLRKVTKSKSVFPTDDSLLKMLCPLSRIDGQKNIRYNGKERGQRKWKTNGKKG
ncbi:IS256 family transposase [Hungatella sp.]|uniref:IS256 family transposase n=1 Tax=Hungatella sp. TaxID=2613924 RepID=UPI002A808F10|nr:IS256 family transposase [Hungatella sp.]